MPELSVVVPAFRERDNIPALLRGLASACIEGMLASSAPYLAVIDADLQHDETLVPKLLEAAKRDSADIVVASRYMEGGSTGALAAERVRASRAASALS